MPAATPTLETVIDAVAVIVTANAGGGATVKKFEHTLDNEVEYIESVQNATTWAVDLWLIDVDRVDEEEGRGAGEVYETYPIRVRAVIVRKASTGGDWSKQGRLLFEAVRDDLSKDDSVFAIGGQQPLRTPKVVRVESWGKKFYTDLSGAEQTVYEGVLRLDVEARRWGA